MQENQSAQKKTFIDPIYLRGEFYEKSSGSKDAAFKVEQLILLMKSNEDIILPKTINRIADVGCGMGVTTFLLQEMLTNFTGSLTTLDGYDIHPHVAEFTGNDHIRFYSGDFCTIADGIYDLVVLFDVIEHIPDPISFIKAASRHARLMAFHIPLDNSIMSLIRNLPRENLEHPGHILVLDLPTALNLLTFSGLRILDYDYSPGFLTHSGRGTTFQKIMYPFRWALYKINPYLTQKLLSAVSVTVLAWTVAGLSKKI